MMATQRRGRAARQPVTRSEQWEQAFEEQLLAPNFLERMRAFARGRARLVSRYRKVDEYYASELVQDVLDDTWEGVLTWDPARVDLEKHVMDSIQSRSRHDCLHAKRFHHESLDNEGSQALVEIQLGEEQARREEREALRRVSDAIMAALRSLAADDPEVLLLVDAYEQHAIKKVDVLEVTGLTSAQYKAARERLRRLRDHLPQHLYISASRHS
jgi:hypothetical protein